MSVPARLSAVREGWERVAPPRRPVLLINPRSGDGKAARAALADRARERGIEPVVLGPGDDLAALVASAVNSGADALGMAGGDGSLAPVAAAAAEHDLPFICLPAGTRNHFALDLGIARHDLIGALDAFTAGLERRIDMAEVNGRPFLNNVSLGIYGEAVRRSGYRDAKLRTMLDTVRRGAQLEHPDSGATRHRRHGSSAHLSAGRARLEQRVRPGPAIGPRVRGHGSTPADWGSSCWIRLAPSVPRSSRGARPRWRSRPPRPYPRASTARPSPCCRRSGAQLGPPRCASGSRATIRASRPRPCSRRDHSADGRSAGIPPGRSSWTEEHFGRGGGCSHAGRLDAPRFVQGCGSGTGEAQSE